MREFAARIRFVPIFILVFLVEELRVRVLVGNRCTASAFAGFHI